MISCCVLDPPVPGAFLAMTFPAYRHLLSLQPVVRLMTESDQPPIQPVAIAALDGGAAVGLAVAELPIEGETHPELLSIFVSPNERGRGVGRQLLLAMEDEISTRGFAELRAIYTVGGASTPAVERLLAVNGWSAPEPRTLSVELTTQDTLTLPWLNRLPVRSGCEIVPWADITEDEKENLRRSQEEKQWIAPDLVPWRHEAHGFEPVTSVALRSEDGVVGWVINHRSAPDTLRFTCSYIRKDMGRRARILPLYSASIGRLSQTKFTRCTFVAPMRHPTMAAFVRRRVEPWATSVRETRGSFMILGGAKSERVHTGCGPGSREGTNAAAAKTNDSSRTERGAP